MFGAKHRARAKVVSARSSMFTQHLDVCLSGVDWNKSYQRSKDPMSEMRENNLILKCLSIRIMQNYVGTVYLICNFENSLSNVLTDKVIWTFIEIMTI